MEGKKTRLPEGRMLRKDKEDLVMSDTIEFSEWKKLDIRVGEIKTAEYHPNADHLLILHVDVGEERQLVAGLRNYYRPEELVGKKVVVFVNLKPTKLRGYQSQGMVLAAIDSEKDVVSLLTVDRAISNGARIE